MKPTRLKDLSINDEFKISKEEFFKILEKQGIQSLKYITSVCG